MFERESKKIPGNTLAHRQLRDFYRNRPVFTVDTFHHTHTLIDRQSVAGFIFDEELLFLLILEDMITMNLVGELLEAEDQLEMFDHDQKIILREAYTKWKNQQNLENHHE